MRWIMLISSLDSTTYVAGRGDESVCETPQHAAWKGGAANGTFSSFRAAYTVRFLPEDIEHISLHPTTTTTTNPAHNIPV